MLIIVSGDIHGSLDKMYEKISHIEKERELRVDLVIQLGDFQAVRNEEDLKNIPVPLKHRKVGDFCRYYDAKQVPLKTYFIGGNHENNLWMSKFEGKSEIIGNLFYLGRSGFSEENGIKIGWVSGNYSPKDFDRAGKGKYNHFTINDLHEVEKAAGIDVLFMHDWPSIESLAPFIDTNSVLPDAALLERQIKRKLGCEPLYQLARRMKPQFVFAGHVHSFLMFSAIIDRNTVRFVFLNRIEWKNSLALLDTIKWEILVF